MAATLTIKVPPSFYAQKSPSSESQTDIPSPQTISRPSTPHCRCCRNDTDYCSDHSNDSDYDQAESNFSGYADYPSPSVYELLGFGYPCDFESGVGSPISGSYSPTSRGEYEDLGSEDLGVFESAAGSFTSERSSPTSQSPTLEATPTSRARNRWAKYWEPFTTVKFEAIFKSGREWETRGETLLLLDYEDKDEEAERFMAGEQAAARQRLESLAVEAESTRSIYLDSALSWSPADLADKDSR